jgi:hypothetical protein
MVVEVLLLYCITLNLVVLMYQVIGIVFLK